MTLDEFRSAFERYKIFSDFLGFHARCYICGFVSWYAVLPYSARFIVSLDGGPPWHPAGLTLGAAVLIGMLGYSAIMFWYILCTIVNFARARLPRLPRAAAAAVAAPVLAMECGIFIGIQFAAFQQPLSVIGPTERVYCVLNRSFGVHHLGIGKPLPRCAAILANTPPLAATP